MQIFTYKKRGFENLNIYASRIKKQGLFFISDFQSHSMRSWVGIGFDWTVCYRTYTEMVDLARFLKSILCIFENGKLVECLDFEEDFRITYSQEINVKDPMNDEPEWSEGVGGVIEAPEDVVIDEEVSVKFIPSAGFTFVGWYNEKNDLLSKEVEYKFIVTKSETIKARSQKQWCNVSCEYDNSMGLVNGLGRYVYGTEVTLYAIGKMGYRFKIRSDGYKEDMRKVLVIKNINLEVEFEVNDVVVNAHVYPVGAGHIVNVNNITQEGQMADFRADAIGEYIFDRFTYATEENPTGEETESSTSNPVNIKLLAGRNITARFKLPDVNVTVKSSYNDADPVESEVFVEGNSGGTVSNAGGDMTPGTVFETTAIPAEGYDFKGWYTSESGGSPVETDPTYLNTVTGENTIYARFQKKWFTVKGVPGQYTESVEVGPDLPPTQSGNGSMRVSYGAGVIVSCTLPRDTDEYEYFFDGWYENGVRANDDGATTVIEPVTRDVTLEARGRREIASFKLTVVPCLKPFGGGETYIESDQGGTVEPLSGTYKKNDHVSLTATVSAASLGSEYAFDGYFEALNSGTALSYSKVYGFNITMDMKIYARFSETHTSGAE